MRKLFISIAIIAAAVGLVACRGGCCGGCC
jgi:hypothetical protein